MELTGRLRIGTGVALPYAGTGVNAKVPLSHIQLTTLRRLVTFYQAHKRIFEFWFVEQRRTFQYRGAHGTHHRTREHKGIKPARCISARAR